MGFNSGVNISYWHVLIRVILLFSLHLVFQFLNIFILYKGAPSFLNVLCYLSAGNFLLFCKRMVPVWWEPFAFSLSLLLLYWSNQGWGIANCTHTKYYLFYKFLQ